MTTTTLPTTTTTTAPTTTTTTAPPNDACAELVEADRAAFNAHINSLQAALSRSLSGSQLVAALAQLEASRAAGDARFEQLLAALAQLETSRAAGNSQYAAQAAGFGC